MKIIEAQSVPALFVESPDARAHLEDIIGAVAARYSLTEVHRAHQVHGDAILVDASGECDGIIITKPATGALIRTADCFPLVVADAEKPLVGIFHCGWRGVAADLPFKGVSRLRVMGARTLRAALFPGIERCCFEVKEDVLDQLSAAGIPIEHRAGRTFADLGAAIVERLAYAGIGEIEDLSRCTACTPGLFSHRRGHDGRRHATIVWIPR